MIAVLPSCMHVVVCIAEGFRCQQCWPGQLYPSNGRCIKCPDSVYAVWIGMGLMLLVFSAFSYWLNKKKVCEALFG